MVKVELDIRAQIANLNKGLDKTEKQLKELQTQSNKTSKTIQGNMNKTNTAVTKLTGALGAMLTIGAAVQFTKAIINTRKEFETFRAVLTNTLGSAQAANAEFAKIQKFAADTPFQVKELTDAFVRLVNQGFKPTTIELRKLGDLASSVGKSFIQLSEAIIDAQVGEFERLKEFGIRARKEGDLVTFTFKEQATQVEFTSLAIQEYILSLGDLEGVSGAMAAISKTLEGRLSELEDAWDDLLDTMGGRSQGVFKGIINFFSDMIGKISGALKEIDPETGAIGAFQNLKEILAEIEDDQRAGGLIQVILGLETQLISVKIAIREMNTEQLGGVDNAVLLSEQLEIQIELYRDLLDEINAGTDDIPDFNDAVEEEIETITTLQKSLKGLIDDRKELNIEDEAALEIINKKIKATQDQIKELTTLGVLEAKKVKEQKIEDIKFDESPILELEKEQAEERKALSERLNRDIAFIEQQRIDKQLAAAETAIETERLLQIGKVEAVMSGLDLIAAANRDNAEIQQAVSIVQSIINGAVGITKTGAELGYPAAIPFQIALGLQTLAQIALIRSQKFERGGYDVLSGRRHAQGGIAVGFGEEAEDGEGRAFFTRAATKKYGKFLPAFVKAINEDKLNDVTDSGSYNFNFDDSRSVSELQGIRKLLSKKEISYEGGYRIETRNGQRTKVKI